MTILRFLALYPEERSQLKSLQGVIEQAHTTLDKMVGATIRKRNNTIAWSIGPLCFLLSGMQCRREGQLRRVALVPSNGIISGLHAQLNAIAAQFKDVGWEDGPLTVQEVSRLFGAMDEAGLGAGATVRLHMDAAAACCGPVQDTASIAVALCTVEQMMATKSMLATMFQ